MTWEDPGKASTSLSNPASTPSSASSVVGGAALAAPSTTLGGVAKSVSYYSVDIMREVCGVRGVVWSLGPTFPWTALIISTALCKFKPLYYKFNSI